VLVLAKADLPDGTLPLLAEEDLEEFATYTRQQLNGKPEFSAGHQQPVATRSESITLTTSLTWGIRVMPETTSKAAKRPAKTPKAAKQAQGSPAPAKRPVGAPTNYNTHIAFVICTRIAEGESLREIVKTAGMPERTVVYDWLFRHPEFANQYTRAREEQAETHADAIVDIADETPATNPVLDSDGEVIAVRMDSGYVAWQKQRIEARKWTAMKLKPKKYGDRVAVEGVEGGAAIKTEDANASKFLEVIKNMEMTKRAG